MLLLSDNYSKLIVMGAESINSNYILQDVSAT